MTNMANASNINISRIIINQDKEFTLNILANLLQCKICCNILTDPYDCLCCNQTFCFSCISNYVSKNKKCPYDLYLTREEADEFSLLSKLKPTSLNLVNIINSLKVTCVNACNGCLEELALKDVQEHEKSCTFQSAINIITYSPPNSNGNSLDNSKSLSRCSSYKKADMRRISMMSFNKSEDNIDPLEGCMNMNMNMNAACNFNNGHVTDKLDQIYDILQYLQLCIGKSTSSKDKDIVSETPKFNLSYSTNKQADPNSNYNSNFIFQELKENIGNMAFTSNTYHNNYISSQGEKILSQFENLSDRLSELESHVDNRLSQSENSMRRILEGQISSVSEKIADSSTSLKLMPSPKSHGKSGISPSSPLQLEIDSSFASVHFQDKQLHKPKSVDNLHNKKSSPRPSVECKSKKNVTPQNINISTNPSSPSNFNLSNRKPSTKFATKTVDKIPDKLTERMERLEQNIINNIAEASENMKKFLTDSCVEEIKKNNFEVILDSSNLFVQKIDEVLEKLK